MGADGGAAFLTGLRALRRRLAWRVHDLLSRQGRPDAVLIGDSITYEWLENDPGFFLAHRRRNAGIGGQRTRDMLARFERDVVASAPRLVHIMAGTNDLWYGEAGERGEIALAHIAAMAGMARAAGIGVVLAAPPPIGTAALAIILRPDLFQPLRDGVAALAAAEGDRFVDYADALAGADGRLRPAFTTDGVHLTRAGYRAMRRQAEQVLRAGG